MSEVPLTALPKSALPLNLGSPCAKLQTASPKFQTLTPPPPGQCEASRLSMALWGATRDAPPILKRGEVVEFGVQSSGFRMRRSGQGAASF